MADKQITKLNKLIKDAQKLKHPRTIEEYLKALEKAAKYAREINYLPIAVSYECKIRDLRRKYNLDK
jgi:hypothetical protein